MKSRYPQSKLNIIGGGIIGAMEAYFAWQQAKQNNQTIKVTIHERYAHLTDSTTSNIVPSLTPDEILSVVPRGQDLFNKLSLKFNQPGGIRVDDAPEVSASTAAAQFKQAVKQYSEDEAGHQQRTASLFALGKLSMDLWENLYRHADTELRKIFEESNYNPCHELSANQQQALHNGYRIDLIYDINQAASKATAMKKDYQALGYQHCKLLTPDEVIQIDPALKDFCKKRSHYNANGDRVWNQDAVALWRPGGCLDTQVFIPKFYRYLERVMGVYVNDKGETKNCFSLKLNHLVRAAETEVIGEGHSKITRLSFFNRDKMHAATNNYSETEYVFCPGEAVGTLKNLGFDEPAYAGFAGPSLMINIPLEEYEVKEYSNFKHCMEVHQEGVVLAWQARVRDNKFFIGVGGTKAFYADQRPHKDEEFALDRNLLQLNMINDVLPQMISKALGKYTQGTKLTADDLNELEKRGIATRWVGVRAVAYDGYPTLGYLHQHNQQIINGRCTTHLGSGGVSFAPAAVFASRSAVQAPNEHKELISQVMRFGDSRRFNY